MPFPGWKYLMSTRRPLDYKAFRDARRSSAPAPPVAPSAPPLVVQAVQCSCCQCLIDLRTVKCDSCHQSRRGRRARSGDGSAADRPSRRQFERPEPTYSATRHSINEQQKNTTEQHRTPADPDLIDPAVARVTREKESVVFVAQKKGI